MNINNNKETASGFSCPTIGRRLTPEEIKEITKRNQRPESQHQEPERKTIEEIKTKRRS